MKSQTGSERQLPARDQVLEAVARVASESPALEARVFGSWARGTQSRRSDIDVLIVEETQAPFLSRSDRYLLPLYEAAGGPPVEVLVYAPAELAAMRARPFIRRALEESVVVYRRHEYGPPVEAVTAASSAR